MTSSIKSGIEFSKEVSFEEWFEKSPDPVKVDQERFKANHPASRIYTLNPGDSLTKKCAKIALRVLLCVTIVPIICVKAIDFFKGKKRTLESDLNEKLERLKNKIKRDQSGMLITVKDGIPPYPLPNSEEKRDSLCERALDMFRGDQEKALRFLGVMNQDLGQRLVGKLKDDHEVKKIFIPEGFDQRGSLGFGGPSFLAGEREGKDQICVDFYEKKVVAKFELDAQFYPDSGHTIETLAKGVAEVFLDFKKEQVQIAWKQKS